MKMNKQKIQINALLCQNRSFKVWFWLMIVCVILAITLGIFREVTSKASTLVNILFPLLCIPGCIFNYIFAKGCKGISETLYKCWVGLTLLTFTDVLLTALTDVQDNYISGIILIIELILCIKIVRILVKGYTGLLGDLGKYLKYILILCGIGIGALIVVTIISYTNESFSITPIIGPAICLAGYIIFYFVKFLAISYRLLNNGLLLTPNSDVSEEIIRMEDEKSKFSKTKGNKKWYFSLNDISSKITACSRIIWIAIAIIIVCIVIVILKNYIGFDSNNIKVYHTYEDVLKDASKNNDPFLKPFFENEDIIGLAIDQYGFVRYFSQTEFNDPERTNTINGLPADNYDIVNKGEWNINDGALVFYNGEGTSYITIIDGYEFYGDYIAGICWNEDWDEQSEVMGDIGYAPTKSSGERLKKFLWKEYKEYNGILWAKFAPESEAEKKFHAQIEAIPTPGYGGYDVTCERGRNPRFRAENVVDNNSRTAWVIGENESKELCEASNGISPLIYMRPKKKVPISDIKIIYGCYSFEVNPDFSHSLNWENFGRVKKITIMGCSDNSQWADNLYEGTFPDEIGWQTIQIPEPALYDYYSIIIDDYYPGKTNNDIAISEIAFFE